jgi:DNA helicase-2/ATP-dependent DNA helicase PcrA
MSLFLSNYNRLNKHQKEAVDAIDGPVMVIAGPGTGKTQILSLRIANILQKTDASAENILCITFTEAGVSAMRERLTKFIGSDAYKVSINTFHGFANEVIQTFPEKFAFSRNLSQLDDLTRIKILQEIIDESDALDKFKPFYDNYAKIGDITLAFGILKKEGITPDIFDEKLQNLIKEKRDNPVLKKDEPTKKWLNELEKLESLNELVYIYRTYQSKLKEDGFYDYEDMIMFVIDKFEEDSELLSYYQEQFLYIHVDEYQDTNGAQNKIIELLGKNHIDNSPNIFVVGDDDQAIYRFQGASLGNILFFTNHFSGVKQIVTPENYRSTQLILNIADSVIKNNNFRLVNQSLESAQDDKNTQNKPLEKKLISFRSREEGDSGVKGDVREFENEEAENIHIAKEIKRLYELGIKYSDIAVIYRKNYHSDSINSVLEKFDIPTRIDTSRSVFESNSVAQLINLLNVVKLFDKNLDEKFYEVLQYEFLELETVSAWKIANKAYREKKSIFEELSEVTEQEVDHDSEGAVPEQRLLLNSFFNKFVSWHRASLNMKFSQFLEFLLEDSGMLKFYLKNEPQVDQESSNNFNDLLAINSFYKYIQQQEEVDPELTMTNFLNDLELIKENKIKIALPKIDSGKDAVNLLTAHGSKGLEFKHVFIIKATDSNWGKVRKTGSLIPEEIYSFDIEGISDKDLSLEDERRLFFVAITRAKDQVHFTYAKEYSYQGSITNPSISQFIKEIDSDLIDTYEAGKDSELEVEDIARTLSSAPPKDYTEEEKAFLVEQIDKFKLSASSLNAYINSPLDFKIRHLVRIPKAKQKHAALGTAVHYAIENFNRSLLSKSSDLVPHQELPSLELMLKDFEDCLKDEFYGHDEYESTLKEGLNIISNYYENYFRNTDQVRPIEVEYNFYYHNVFYDPSVDGFSDIEPIPISGRIDKLELINGSVTEVKVVDYKTGSDKTRNQILGQTKNAKKNLWRQLVFYKLLGDLDTKFRPERSMKNQKYRITHAELDFMKMNKTSKKFRRELFEITDQDVRELKELIVEVMRRIRNLEFPEESELET